MLSGCSAFAGRIGEGFFQHSGAAAVEIALKMAFSIIRTSDSKNAAASSPCAKATTDTIGAVSLGGIEMFHRIFKPLLFETTFVIRPTRIISSRRAGGKAYWSRWIAHLPSRRRILRRGHRAADTGGCGHVDAAAGFLRGLRELTRRHDVLLIADEVATVLPHGKTVRCDHEGSRPT